ncbi:hypothetical protein BUALT_Bualt03G0042900 [Buddleja alternifolia]|uniref:Rho termination factor-like N-terminal domain-containing protein n=1 Tax=Buddleja alternifolia TaxID=168488 RepID=A0AAV6XYE3_9LAMI|nr:hypothetical protein BUALT_Bualt03G0042900 [Buddleja alternifolia]
MKVHSKQDIPTYGFCYIHYTYILVVYYVCLVIDSSTEHPKFELENMGGGSLLYPNSVLQLPSFSSFSTPKFRHPILSLKGIALFLFNLAEIADNKPSILSIRADGNNRRDRPQKSSSLGRAPKGEAPDDSDPQSRDGRSTMSSNKEEILALFKRIQSSISKGDSVNSKKRNPKAAAAEDKPSAESIFEVLRQSRTRGKEKALGKKRDKLLRSRKDSLKKEERVENALPKEEERVENSSLKEEERVENSSLKKEEIVENSSAMGLKSTRPPSNFTRRSPIPPLSNPRDNLELKSETSPKTDNDNKQQLKKFEEMKLAELKEVAKSKGIKGYSKLKKSELVELLIRS